MKKAFWKFMATGFGAGYSPFAPGTAGALVGILLFLPAIFLENFADSFYCSPVFYAILIILFHFIGVKATNELESEWGHDPQKIVIDEIVGVWITIFLFPITLKIIIAGFILFRIFDIWKPLGIRKMENLKGGWGVMMDDVLAGVYGAIALFILINVTDYAWWTA